MDPDRIRTVVDEVCLALGPAARPADVEAVAAAVLRALGEGATPARSSADPSGVVAVLVDLPLDTPGSPDRSTISAYAWERVHRVGSSVVQLADRAFPGVPVRIRTSSFSRLTAGLRPTDLPVAAQVLERSAADAGIDRILMTWCDLPDAAPGDRAVLEALPYLLDATTRLFGRVDLVAAPGPVEPRHLATYLDLVSRSVRAGVLNAADRVLAGCRGSSGYPGLRIEVVFAPPSEADRARLVRDAGRRAQDQFSRLASWTGLEWHPPQLVRCADCPAPADETLPDLAGSRFKGWPVPDDPSRPWAPVPADRLADALARLAERNHAGVFRMSEPGQHASPDLRSVP